ncbi:aldose 1-epimerase family protein [Clostridium intestinale]|uniref:aldose 1-epimerase family protein n=1 Tax=Clostridium intestinale TaxID=36845 RepID=UPI002DD63D00|nr:aldose 1-epimerase family protein [Clostridium intestinale]WRY53339.1 aldose 1-epimerase family protein [Clostridium intestinale]
MIEKIENEYLSIEIKTFGAELTSVKSIKDKCEVLWQGDDKYWKGQSPILFPIVGKLPEDKYTHMGKIYEMMGHGFGSKSEFKVVYKNADSITFRLCSNEETRKSYPFEFELNIKYTLLESSLKTEFEVINRDNKDMFFSIGAHPAFKCPLLDNESMEDYYLEFEVNENVKRLLLGERLLTGEKVDFFNNEKILSLNHALFYKGAIILENLKSEYIILKNRKNSKEIKCSTKGFPYVGIWSAINDAPFLCIEPWHGINSTYGDGYDITKKEGIIKLEEDKKFKTQYIIEVN